MKAQKFNIDEALRESFRRQSPEAQAEQRRRWRERQRKHRALARNCETEVRVRVSPRVLEALLLLHWLQEHEASNDGAIGEAISKGIAELAENVTA